MTDAESRSTTQRIARELHNVVTRHEDTAKELMTAFTWTAVSLCRWLNMTPARFMETLAEAMRVMEAGAIDGPFTEPTIVGGGEPQ